MTDKDPNYRPIKADIEEMRKALSPELFKFWCKDIGVKDEQ